MAKKQRSTRDISVPPGLVAEFKQTRAGTIKATIVKMAGRASGASVAAIAAAIRQDRKQVLIHLFCIRRDSGYGYEVVGDRATITFPGRRTLGDAIRPRAAEKKAA